MWGRRPSWYAWISDAPGVYHPRIEETGEEAVAGVSLHSAFISLKCYPFERSPVFPLFSFQERRLVKSGLFDRTNTPRFESRDKIPENLFNVASMGYTFDEHGEIALFTFESLDTMRSSFAEETDVRCPGANRPKRFEKGEIDRAIPALEIGYVFFDRLLGLHAFHSRRKPFRIVVSRSPGFEYVHGKQASAACVDAGDVHMYTVDVAFVSEKAKSDALLAERLDLLCLDEGRETLFDRTSPCGHFHGAKGRLPGFMSINPDWSLLAEADFKSSLASSCGCH